MWLIAVAVAANAGAVVSPHAKQAAPSEIKFANKKSLFTTNREKNKYLVYRYYDWSSFLTALFIDKE